MSNTTKYKIAIIGPTDVVSGFKALGVDSLVANNSNEVLEQLRKIRQVGQEGVTRVEGETATYAVVCIIEDMMEGIDEKEYTRLVSGPLPAVVILPSAKGSRGLAELRLRKLAEKAIGAQVI